MPGTTLVEVDAVTGGVPIVGDDPGLPVAVVDVTDTLTDPPYGGGSSAVVDVCTAVVEGGAV